MTLQSPLRRARGLGSAGHGLSHWRLQHLTAVLLIPLMIWLLVSLARLGFPVDYPQLVFWAGDLVNAILLVALLIAGGIHGALGMQVIIEDYVTSAARFMLIGLVKLLAFVVVVAAIIAILRLGTIVTFLQLMRTS